MLGLPYSNFHSKEESEIFLKHSREVKQNSETVSYESYDETLKKWFVHTLSPIIDTSENSVTGVSVISKDITVRVEKEIELNKTVTLLRETRDQLIQKDKMSALGRMASGVAHEIRNPLNTISIAAQRLAGEFAPSDNQDEYLSFTRQIRLETKRLNEIITKFLALAHEEKERVRKINLADLVDQFIQLVKYDAGSVQIDLTVDVDASLEVAADPNNLKQVLSNLFNNAKEALNGEAGKISITGESVKGEALLKFADSGPGIPADSRDKVFTPFYTTKGEGTGLGLPTVYRIITDLGGDVRIEDSDLGGAEFVINLPK